MSDNQDRNAEILRRLQDKRPFEVAREMGVSYATVGGVLRRERNRQNSNDKDRSFWSMVDAWPDPPWTEAEGLAVRHQVAEVLRRHGSLDVSA